MKRRDFINNSILTATGLSLASPLFSCGSPKEPTAFIDRILPAPIGGGYEDPDYWVWGSSVIKGEDGKYHLFYSRWPKKYNFTAWLTHSEIAHAIADHPAGPYTFIEIAMQSHGGNYWDAITAHNPKIKYFDG